MSQTESRQTEQRSPEAEQALASQLQNSGAFAEAAEVYLRLASRVVTIATAVNLGLCLLEIGRFDEAEHWLLLAARHRPAHVEVRRLLGNLYVETGRVEVAELEYRTALAFQPDHDPTRLALAGLLLASGRYAEGWPFLEARVALNPDVVPPVKVSFPQWKGEPLDGKSILVWYEQGFGDQIQLARFAQVLKARGASRVTLGCRPPLVDLLATAPGVDEVVPVPRGEAVSVRPSDFWSRYFSLPGALGVTVNTVPAGPYLAAPADRRGQWPAFKGGVGIAWKASATGFNASNKNIPDDLAQRLLNMGARSLHPEDTGVADFADTAAIMEELDLVISIDTSVAHLAGAMGKPCWTLLPRLHCDWRWMRGRADSPWYPTMRLYRQQKAGDWGPVMDRVTRDLSAWLAAKHGR